jgi:hypothetical protein
MPKRPSSEGPLLVFVHAIRTNVGSKVSGIRTPVRELSVLLVLTFMTVSAVVGTGAQFGSQKQWNGDERVELTKVAERWATWLRVPKWEVRRVRT